MLHSLSLYTTTPMGSWVDIVTATDNIQMYKYKNKIWEIWTQTQLSNMRSALLLLAPFCFLSPFHTQLWVSDRVENKSVSPFALTVLQESSSVRHKHTRMHTHTHPHTQHTISCQTERKYPLRKRNKQKINTSHNVAFSADVPSLWHYQLQLQGLYLSLWALSWCHHGRRWENYKLKHLYVCLAVDSERSQVWFMVLTPTMRGK